MTLVLDAGALIAYERRSTRVQALLERAFRSGSDVRTTTGVIAQIWRDPAKQVQLGRLLRGVEDVHLDGDRARRIGVLLGGARGIDIVDGSIVEVSFDGDEVLTSDPNDIAELATAAGKTLIVTKVS